MYQLYIDHHKQYLFDTLQEVKTETEIQIVCAEIAELWLALGCPADM